MRDILPLLEDSFVFDVFCSLLVVGMQETFDSSLFLFVLIELVGIDTVRAINAAISFRYSYQDGSIFGEKL